MMVDEKTAAPMTTLRQADQPGDELLKVATATPVVFTIQAQGYKFNCPHCGKELSLSALLKEQEPVLRSLAAKQSVAWLGCPQCEKNFRVEAAVLVQPIASMQDVNAALERIKKENPETVNGNRRLRRAAASGLKLVGGPRNGSAR